MARAFRPEVRYELRQTLPGTYGATWDVLEHTSLVYRNGTTVMRRTPKLIAKVYNSSAGEVMCAALNRDARRKDTQSNCM